MNAKFGTGLFVDTVHILTLFEALEDRQVAQAGVEVHGARALSVQRLRDQVDI